MDVAVIYRDATLVPFVDFAAAQFEVTRFAFVFRVCSEQFHELDGSNPDYDWSDHRLDIAFEFQTHC
jgi:hypothetical protein